MMEATGDCLWCDEPLDDDVAPGVVYTPEGPRHQHVECALREVMGGIGHLIAHEYWCIERHDPDAGLTRRQSALLHAPEFLVEQLLSLGDILLAPLLLEPHPDLLRSARCLDESQPVTAGSVRAL
jgi:hypothetical protein